MKKIHFLTCLTLALVSQQALSDGLNCDSIYLVGSLDTPGEAQDIFIQDTTAYIADLESGLLIVDITDPQWPTVLGSYDTSGHTRDVVVVDDIAYIADGAVGLVILDVSDPTLPVHISTFNTPRHARKLTVDGSTIYVMDTTSIHIIDINDPANPELLGVYNDTIRVNDIVIADGLAYIADRSSLLLSIMDFSEPASPTLIGSTTLNSIPKELVYRDGFLYIAAESEVVQIVDVHDPESPEVLSNTWTQGIPNRIEVIGTTAYIANSTSLLLVDVTDPFIPWVMDEYQATGSITGVTVQGGYAYAADSQAGLLILDIHAPPSSPVLDIFSEGHGTLDLWIEDSVAFVINSDRNLEIIDRSDPTSLALLSMYETSDILYGVAVHGNYAYLSSDDTMHVVDISDLRSPISVKQYPELKERSNLQFSGSMLYAQHNRNTLVIIDNSDPASLTQVGSYTFNTSPNEIVHHYSVSDSIAYVVSSDGDTNYTAFSIVDMNEPTNPVLVEPISSPPFPFITRGFLAREGILYFGLTDLHIYDVTDPANLIELAVFDPVLRSSLAAREMYFADGKLYIYQYGNPPRNGVVVIDVTDPHSPQRGSFYSTPHFAYGMAAANDVLYLANSEVGLTTVDMSDHCSQCDADLTDDGAVNFFDVSAFLLAFTAQEPIADFTGDEHWNFFDVSAFLLAFSEGCP